MFLLSSDIDGTLFDGTDATVRFAAYWQSLVAMLEEVPVLAYNTGRVYSDAEQLVSASDLPTPDWFITDVGTSIVSAVDGVPLHDWQEHLVARWDLTQVRDVVSAVVPAPAIELQPDKCQTRFKSSWFWHHATSEQLDHLRAELRASGLDVQVIYSSGRDLDVLPTRANKGNALRFLAQRVGMPLDRLLVAGDSGNDAAMFLPDVHGIVVSNAEPGLKSLVAANALHYLAQQPCADGVIEGIQHFCRQIGLPVLPTHSSESS